MKYDDFEKTNKQVQGEQEVFEAAMRSHIETHPEHWTFLAGQGDEPEAAFTGWRNRMIIFFHFAHEFEKI